MLHIEPLTPQNERDWTQCLERTEGSTFFHTLYWKAILERAFGLQSHYFLIYEDQEAVALCPLFTGKLGPLTGLKSLPMSNYHQILLKSLTSPMIGLILDTCAEIAKKEGLSFVQLTFMQPGADQVLETYRPIPISLEGTMVLDLDRYNPDVIWNRLFKAEDGQRKYIKRITKDGFFIKEVTDPEDIHIFYSLYRENLMVKNVKPLPSEFFQTAWEIVPREKRRLVLLQRNEEILGGLWSFLHPSQRVVYLEHMAINRKLPGSYHPSYFLFWDAIVHAHQHNFRHVCFGGAPKNPTDFYRKQKIRFGCQYEEQSTYIMPFSAASRIMVQTMLRLKK